MNGRALLAEALGTMGLVFVIVCCATNLPSGWPPITIALAVAFYVSGMGTAMGPISGGHFNPAVTIGLVVAGKMKASDAMGYIIAQCVGGIVGSFAASSVFGDGGAGVRAAIKIAPGNGITAMNAMVAELFITLFFILVVLMTAADKRAPKNGALFLGVMLATGIMAIGPVSGAAINPAVGVSLSVTSNSWSSVLSWLAGPIVGGAIAGAIYRGVFQQGEEAA